MGVLNHLMRLPYARGIWERLGTGSVESRVEYGIYPYPHYAYGVYWSAMLASRLGIPRITAIEFGVAGGRGLVSLENVAAEIGRHLGVEIDVVGFDTGQGMPAATDYRDLPHIWGPGFYMMDEQKLRARLVSAKLILGDVEKTVGEWLSQGPAPIGFVAFDLDYYSSTKAALKVLEGPPSTHLPRVHCYFDDLGCTNIGVMCKYVGEYLAIDEFNQRYSDRKVCPIENLRINRPAWEIWQDRMYGFHNFSHELYTKYVLPVKDSTQIPL